MFFRKRCFNWKNTPPRTTTTTTTTHDTQQWHNTSIAPSLTNLAALSTESPRLNSLAERDLAILARGVSCGEKVQVWLSSFLAATTAACGDNKHVRHGTGEHRTHSHLFSFLLTDKADQYQDNRGALAQTWLIFSGGLHAPSTRQRARAQEKQHHRWRRRGSPPRRALEGRRRL